MCSQLSVRTNLVLFAPCVLMIFAYTFRFCARGFLPLIKISWFLEMPLIIAETKSRFFKPLKFEILIC